MIDFITEAVIDLCTNCGKTCLCVPCLCFSVVPANMIRLKKAIVELQKAMRA